MLLFIFILIVILHIPYLVPCHSKRSVDHGFTYKLWLVNKQGNTVASMGSFKGLKTVRRIVEDCIENKMHPIFHIKVIILPFCAFSLRKTTGFT